MKDNQLIKLAIKAAKTAGELLREPTESIKIAHKGTKDLVTQYDKRAEDLICQFLETSGISILAEESGLHAYGEKDARWIIDPLDGTTNFSHHFPHYCISIALEVEGALELAVIYDPSRDELFEAQKNQGAFLNGKKLSVSQASSISSALMLTGFGYDRQIRSEFYLHYFSYFIKKARGVRRCGSAALDLAYIAAGRGDGFWEFNLKPWDVAAGILLIQEAGGFVEGLYPSQPPLNGDIFAGGAKIQKELSAAFTQLHMDLPTSFQPATHTS